MTIFLIKQQTYDSFSPTNLVFNPMQVYLSFMYYTVYKSII